MKEKIYSDLTKCEYSPSDVVRIVNPKQSAAYMAHGAKLLDVYSSRDFKTNEPIIVFIYNRIETTDLYDKWCRHELK